MGTPSNIILVGIMGSGKTSTGKILAKLLNFSFFDMDIWIEEKNNMKINKIFQKKGESFFRQEEEKAINWLKGKNNYVISTGGGAWVNEKNRSMLLKLGWCVWLKVNPEIAWKRVSVHLNQRPLLSSHKNPIEYLDRLLKERIESYSLASSSFDTNEKSSADIAAEIILKLEKIKPFD